MVYGNVAGTGSPLATGLTLPTCRPPLPGRCCTWQTAGSNPVINTVTVRIRGYTFNSMFTSVLGLPFGAVTFRHHRDHEELSMRPAPKSRQAGSTAVEFALVLLVFLTFLLGITDFSRMLYTWNAATEATRAGARYAVVCDDTATKPRCWQGCRRCCRRSAASTWPGITPPA